MKYERGLVGIGVSSPVNAAHDKFPVAGKYGPFKNNRIAYLPSEPPGQLLSRDKSPAVPQKRRFLIIGKDVFTVKVKICPRINGKIGEKVLFIDINAAEPVAP